MVDESEKDLAALEAELADLGRRLDATRKADEPACATGAMFSGMKSEKPRIRTCRTASGKTI